MIWKGFIPGVYRFSEYKPEVEFQWENLALIKNAPESVICLISALVLYDVTDQVMREIWLAVPHKSHSSKRPNTRIVRMRNINHNMTSDAEKSFKAKLRAIAREKNRDSAELW